MRWWNGKVFKVTKAHSWASWQETLSKHRAENATQRCGMQMKTVVYALKLSCWSPKQHEDLVEIDGTHYFLTVDNFLRYPEVRPLTSTMSAAVIKALRSVFSWHGIPETIRSDNIDYRNLCGFATFFEINIIDLISKHGRGVWTPIT